MRQVKSSSRAGSIRIFIAACRSVAGPSNEPIFARAAVAGQQGGAVRRHDDNARFRAVPAGPAVAAIDRGAQREWAGACYTRLWVSPDAARHADAGIARRVTRGGAGRPRVGRKSSRPISGHSIHGRMVQFGDIWEVLEDHGARGRPDDDPRRGQRHRHAHVRKADPRGPDRLREPGRGAQHAFGRSFVQSGDPPGRECRGRGDVYGPCLGRDRRRRDRRRAHAASRSMAKHCTSTCCTQPRTTSGRAGRCTTPIHR